LLVKSDLEVEASTVSLHLPPHHDRRNSNNNQLLVL
jgi:hypothetical protein